MLWKFALLCIFKNVYGNEKGWRTINTNIWQYAGGGGGAWREEGGDHLFGLHEYILWRKTIKHGSS